MFFKQTTTETQDTGCRVLVNANDNEVDSYIPLDKLKRKEYFVNLKDLKTKAKKTPVSIKENLDHLSFIGRVKYKYFYTKMIRYQATADISHNSKYVAEKSKLILKNIKDLSQHKKDAGKNLREKWLFFKKTMKMKTKISEDIAKQKESIAKLKKIKNQNLQTLKIERSSKQISKLGYKTEVGKIRIIYRGDKRVLKMKKHISQSKSELKYIFFKNRIIKKKIKKEYEANLIFLSNTIPNDVVGTWRKWISPIFELIFPGLGSILNKEYYKAFWLIIASTCLYTLTFLFAGGYTQLKINGVLQGGGINGLFTLGGDSKVFQPDSRIFLVMGVLSLLLISTVVIYSAIFSRISHKKAMAMHLGYRVGGKATLKQYLSTNGFPYMVITPIYFVLLITSIFPIVVSILITFTNYGEIGHVAPMNLVTWVGFDNLKNVFNFSGLQGKYFIKTLGWSFIWGVGATITSTIAGVGLALLVNHPRFKGKSYIRVLFLLPTAIPFFVMVLYFKIFFGPTGTMNHDVVLNFAPWLDKHNLDIAPNVSMEFAKVQWFSKVNLVKSLLFLLNIWFGFSGMFLFITGLLQGISKDLYEAVDIAGGGAYTKFTKITGPTLMYQISPILIGAFIGGFNNFGLIYLFTEGGPNKTVGGPGETDILASFVFKLVRDKGKPALAATYMFAISILFGVGGLIGFSRTKTFRKGNY